MGNARDESLKHLHWGGEVWDLGIHRFAIRFEEPAPVEVVRMDGTISAGPVPGAAERLLEADLGRWAGARIAKGGRQDALLGRVEALRLSGLPFADEARQVPMQLLDDLDPDGDGIRVFSDTKRGTVAQP